MQPGNFSNGRLSRLPLAVNTVVAGFVLVTILAAGAFSCLAADQPGSYGKIPVKRWSADDIRALPDGQERLDRELQRQGEYSRRWHIIHDLVGKQHLSHKSGEHLRSRGLGGALLDKKADGLAFPSGAQAVLDTLKVLIIRIGFETNREPNLNTIDPGGDFVLDPLTDPKPLEVDPPPRNKAFFEAHLDGLSEYYKYMSGNRLHIEGKVLPEGGDDSYKITDVADYGPGKNGFWTLESLERLVQDIMVKADQETQADGSANLAEYGDDNPFGYIIFVHAGSDWQSDVNGDSPNDIPTFFVTLGEPVDLIGSTPAGPGKLSECSIIPETTNTDDFPGSIAAAFYHEFGHALGLPDVYSTSTGLPAVGIWDLMDSGTNLPVTLGTITAENDTFVISATGVLPPSISAWNKYFLGWLEMGELQGREKDYFLPAVGVPKAEYWRYPELVGYEDTPQAYKAGLSEREWFLLENRWVPDLRFETTPFDSLSFERDENTGVVLYLAGKFNGTWGNSGLYDYFMPPGGLLVWHVNNDRIEANLPDNTINAYNDGLKLVEADGIQDIGVLDAYVQGWYGSFNDPFGGSDYSGNPTGYDNLYVDGYPSSRNFDRSWSGLSLTDVGPRTSFSTSVVKFKASLGPIDPGFPYELPPIGEFESLGSGGLQESLPRAIDPESLTPVLLNGGGQQALIFAEESPENWTGGDYRAALFHVWADGFRGGWAVPPGKPADSGAFQNLGGPLIGSPFLQERSGDGVDLVWATTNGSVGITYLPEYVPPTATVPVRVGERLAAGPAPLIWQSDSPRILCPVYPDSLVLLDGTGTPLGQPLKIAVGEPGLQIATPFPGLGDSDIAPVVTTDGWYLVRQDDNGLVADPDFHPFVRAAAEMPAWTAVVKVDGGHQLHIVDSTGELGCWGIEPDGSVSDLGLVLGIDEPLVCPPAVADVDGDGRDDLVMATGRRILAMRPDGVDLRGFPVRFYDLFPLPDTTRVAGPLVVADGTGDGVNEIYFNTDGGHLVGLGATGRLLNQMPLRWGDRNTGSLAVGGPDDGRVLWLVSPGGYTGPPMDRQFANGRVTGYGLANAASEDARTSEWRGPSGGSFRRGSAGTAKGLGAAAPVSAEIDKFLLYPNPVISDEVTVRFFSKGSRAARIFIYNLEGEKVVQAEIPVQPNAINEFVLPLPGIASGLYLARLEYDAGSGVEIRTLTLAVEK